MVVGGHQGRVQRSRWGVGRALRIVCGRANGWVVLSMEKEEAREEGTGYLEISTWLDKTPRHAGQHRQLGGSFF